MSGDGPGDFHDVLSFVFGGDTGSVYLADKIKVPTRGEVRAVFVSAGLTAAQEQKLKPIVSCINRLRSARGLAIRNLANRADLIEFLKETGSLPGRWDRIEPSAKLAAALFATMLQLQDSSQMSLELHAMARWLLHQRALNNPGRYSIPPPISEFVGIENGKICEMFDIPEPDLDKLTGIVKDAIQSENHQEGVN